MYKLCFYIPESHIEQVKDALFDKGAGRTTLYDRCSWQILGEGQFRPLEESHPFIGTKQQIKKIAEYKVEMICTDEVIVDVVKELVSKHPYEEPAYEIYKVITTENLLH